MAPLKEADTLVGTSAPADNAAKNPAETATRTQPVALEIPVTINGAHTVAGSDKREPFSETTQTVLVFAVGAVVRVSTSLAPGQLVFLTNEKTKKEVVCQVLKSKSGGSGGGYVELQFTEPAPGFWGLRLAGGPAPAPAPAAPAPKPVATVPAPTPAKPAAVPPPPAATLSESVLAKPKVPTAAPVLPAAVPKTAGATSSPSLRISPPSQPPSAAPLVSVPPPSPLASVKEQAPPVQAAPPLPPPPAAEPTTPTSSTSPDSSSAASDKRPGTPVLHDYTKDIDALFTAPSSHAPAPPAAPADSSVPSTEQLKADAARLQAQLSSLLFSEAPAASASPLPKPESSVLAQKIFEIAKEEPKSAAISEPAIPVPPARKLAAPPASAEEQEVKVPAWLTPLSQGSEPAAPSLSVESADEVSAISGESSADPVSQRSDAAVFGGQLLAGSSETKASTGSKKGLWIAIAAAAVLAVTVAAWYLRADLFGSSKSPVNKPAPAIASSLPPAQPAAESKPSVSSPEPNLNSAPAPVTASSAPVSHPQAVKATEPNASAALSNAAARELKSFTAEPKKPTPVASPQAPAPEPEDKSGLGDVHLATPKVSRSASQQAADALPSIDTQATGSVNDALASSVRGGTPSVPLPVGGEVQSAQLIKSVPPVYPLMAKSQHVSGNVQIDALIDASGNVAELKILSGPGMLHRAALDAVKQWKYKPAMLDGQPTSMHLTVTVQFRAQ